MRFFWNEERSWRTSFFKETTQTWGEHANNPCVASHNVPRNVLNKKKFNHVRVMGPYQAKRLETEQAETEVKSSLGGIDQAVLLHNLAAKFSAT